MKKTVLVIDDEKQFLEEMQVWLGEKGYECLTAESGQQGLEVLDRKNPNLVLLDVAMPGKDGFEVLEELRGNPKTATTPVIMLTAKAETDFIFRSQQLRAVDYITKPFEDQELLRQIRRFER